MCVIDNVANVAEHGFRQKRQNAKAGECGITVITLSQSVWQT